MTGVQSYTPRFLRHHDRDPLRPVLVHGEDAVDLIVRPVNLLVDPVERHAIWRVDLVGEVSACSEWLNSL